VSIAGAPLNRQYQRFLAWGSTLYMFGGFQAATSTQNNDLWAVNLQTAVLAVPSLPATWTQVSPNVNGVVPGYPPPRVGYSWIAYSVGAVMFGGISNSAPGSTLDVCFPPRPAPAGWAPPATCMWHRHVWIFLPGEAPNPTQQYAMPASAWKQLADVGAPGDNNGAVPTGRVDASVGALADQLYVYGGFTATGPSSELWTYSLTAQTWALVPATFPAPGAGLPPTARSFPTGTFVGHHFYVWNQVFDNSGGAVQNSGSLWRWTLASGPPAAPAAPIISHAAIQSGHTAGIILGILLGLVNLVFLKKIADDAGVTWGLPAFSLPGLPSLPTMGGGVAKSSAAGFYASAPSAEVANGGYAAPAEL
jgi:hypothetical protein